MSTSSLSSAEVLQRIKARLPHSTTRLVRVVGWEGTLKFLRLHGGRKVYFPTKLLDEHPLYESLTDKQIAAMTVEYGGELIQLPKVEKMLNSEKYQQVAMDFQGGKKVAEIAERHGYTQMRVYQVLKRLGIKARG